MKVLVTGGCGYIGSHTIVDLEQNGFEAICVDSNIRSSSDILLGVESILGKKIPHYAFDLCDSQLVKELFEEHSDIGGIIHFAAFKSVPESVKEPLAYYKNNIESLLNLLTEVQRHKIPNFIFSSSCSVYGNTQELPVTELTLRQKAESPYGNTKQMGEDIIEAFSKANSANTILLRYFNPVGAHHSSSIGEVSDKPENLVPIITQTAIGVRDSMTVYGSDYDTRDGSCIRDYIHVMDIANAHTKALQYLVEERNDSNCEIFNLGTGQGVSVLEAIKAFEKVSSKKLNYSIGPRRDGDVIAIYADNQKAKDKLKWEPQYSIDDMMSTAWDWEQQWRNPNFKW